MSFVDPTPTKLAGLDRRFRQRAGAFVSWTRSRGVPLVVISGRRTAAQNRHVGGAPRSRHLLGQAIDVQIWPLRRDQVPREWWDWLGLVGEHFGLRWGGRFSRPDLNHFDIG